jgi:archaellum component FlaC
MDAIQTIFSSPLPVAISAVIAVACLAGYWFFVIPLLEEVKTLRETNVELQSKLGGEFEQQKASIQRFMQEVMTGVQNQQNVGELVSVINALRTTVEQQTNALNSTLVRILDDIQESIARLSPVISNLSETSARKDDEIRREVERLGRLLESLTRTVADISDKQSQVAGVLTGMSIASMNRSL